MRFSLAALGFGERGVEFLLALGGEVLAKLEADVVVDDGLLDSRDGDVRQVAESVLSCAA